MPLHKQEQKDALQFEAQIPVSSNFPYFIGFGVYLLQTQTHCYRANHITNIILHTYLHGTLLNIHQ
jgi:hypothetical protein